MKYRDVTGLYYAEWLGLKKPLTQVNGVEFVYSLNRNIIQRGFSQPLDLYCFCSQGKTIISYGDRAINRIEILQDSIRDGMSICDLKCVLTNTFEKAPCHYEKFVFSSIQYTNGTARLLELSDYSAYLEFFKKVNPRCADMAWVSDYFNYMVSERLCSGAFVGSTLVSCTDSPEVPYLKDFVREIGINTLPEYRNMGYANSVCALSVKSIVENGKCPIWSTDSGNIASKRLAQKTGFQHFADVLTVSI